MTTLHDPISIGDLALRNRIAMAPLTRARAGEAGVPMPLTAVYYAQRASAGLIVSEATNVSPLSAAFELAPGVYCAAQAAGWRQVADAVHARDGLMFMQLWHAGRVGSSALLGGREPLSPSGVNDDLALLQVYGALRNGHYARLHASPSRAMSEFEIYNAINAFRQGAVNAVRNGMDGVEIHAANGYLPAQFLSPHVNRRADLFGGSLANRARFLRLIIEAVLELLPATRIGVRLSPFAAYNNAADPRAADTYAYVAAMLDDYGVGYIHAADSNAWGGAADMERLLRLTRLHYRGTVIANAGLDAAAAHALIAAGAADMASFGRDYIANPDLVERIAAGGPYNQPDPLTFYGGGERGYTDYPFLRQQHGEVTA